MLIDVSIDESSAYVMYTYEFLGYYFVFFQAEDGIRDLVRSRGLGDVYKRQGMARSKRNGQKRMKKKRTHPPHHLGV